MTSRSNDLLTLRHVAELGLGPGPTRDTTDFAANAEMLFDALVVERSMSRTEVWAYLGRSRVASSSDLNTLRDALVASGVIKVRRRPSKVGRPQERWYYTPPTAPTDPSPKADGASLEPHPADFDQHPPVEGQMSDNTEADTNDQQQEPPNAADSSNGISHVAQKLSQIAAAVPVADTFTSAHDMTFDQAQTMISSAWVDPRDLWLANAYARAVSPIKVLAYAPHFSYLKANSLILNEREPGVLLVLDGGHRGVTGILAGAPKMHALVYHGLTLEQEAGLAAALNRERKLLTPAESFKMLIAEQQQVALDIVRIADKHDLGIMIPGNDEITIASTPTYAKIVIPGTRASAPGRLRAISTLFAIYSMDITGTVLDATLDTVSRAWPLKTSPVRPYEAPLLMAVAMITDRFQADERFKRERWIKRLSAPGRRDILRGNVTRTEHGTATLKWISALLEEHDAGLQQHLRLAPPRPVMAGPGKRPTGKDIASLGEVAEAIIDQAVASDGDNEV